MSTGNTKRRSDEAKWATAGLMRAAAVAQDAKRGSVELWDARTSANDWRAALSIAVGAPIACIHPVLGTHRTDLREAS